MQLSIEIRTIFIQSISNYRHLPQEYIYAWRKFFSSFAVVQTENNTGRMMIVASLTFRRFLLLARFDMTSNGNITHYISLRNNDATWSNAPGEQHIIAVLHQNSRNFLGGMYQPTPRYICRFAARKYISLPFKRWCRVICAFIKSNSMIIGRTSRVNVTTRF